MLTYRTHRQLQRLGLQHILDVEVEGVVDTDNTIHDPSCSSTTGVLVPVKVRLKVINKYDLHHCVSLRGTPAGALDQALTLIYQLRGCLTIPLPSKSSFRSLESSGTYVRRLDYFDARSVRTITDPDVLRAAKEAGAHLDDCHTKALDLIRTSIPRCFAEDEVLRRHLAQVFTSERRSLGGSEFYFDVPERRMTLVRQGLSRDERSRKLVTQLGPVLLGKRHDEDELRRLSRMLKANLTAAEDAFERQVQVELQRPLRLVMTSLPSRFTEAGFMRSLLEGFTISSKGDLRLILAPMSAVDHLRSVGMYVANPSKPVLSPELVNWENVLGLWDPDNVMGDPDNLLRAAQMV